MIHFSGGYRERALIFRISTLLSCSIFSFFVTYSLVCCRKPLILLTLWEYRYPTLIFDRPAFKEMMQDVTDGNINCVIVKDYCAIIGLNQKDLENQGILA